jgi:putative Mg2+ transporter-C (MgtC) family protein
MGRQFEYRMILHTEDARHIGMLAAYLLKLKQVRTFQLSPTGD